MTIWAKRWDLPYVIPELKKVGLYLHDIPPVKNAPYNEKWFDWLDDILKGSRTKGLQGLVFKKVVYNGRNDFAMNLPAVDFVLSLSTNQNIKDYRKRIHEVIPDLVRVHGNKVDSFVLDCEPEVVPEVKATKPEVKEVPVNQSLTLKEVNALSQLSATYEYEDKVVVPSQSYAKFSNRDVKDVNRAIQRVAESGRLNEGVHFFKLDSDQAKDWFKVTDCRLPSNHGVTLLTKTAVNTLSHYFNDDASVNLSNSVNETATRAQEVGALGGTAALRMIADAIDAQNAKLEAQAAAVTELVTKIKVLEERPTEKFDIEKINLSNFPKDCLTLEEVNHQYFKGIPETIVRNVLKVKNHPTREWLKPLDGKLKGTDGGQKFEIQYIPLNAYTTAGLRKLADWFFQEDIVRSNRKANDFGVHYNSPTLGKGFYHKVTTGA